MNQVVGKIEIFNKATNEKIGESSIVANNNVGKSIRK